MKPVGPTGSPRSTAGTKARNVLFTLLGVTGLLLKARYAGPSAEFVHDYGGNITASFAVYFILANPLSHLRRRCLLTALLALAVVDLFEATDGFKVMSNTYDPADYLANTAGIALALLVDIVVSRAAGLPPTRNE